MKKLFTLVTVIVLALFFIVPANAAMKDMWAKVYSWDGKQTARGLPVLTEITENVTYVVMMRNSVATLETLTKYDDDAYTSLANPVSGTNFGSATVGNDMIRFRVDPTETNDTYVDLIVVDQAGGYTAFVEDFDEYTHTIVIDERPNKRHHGVAFIYTTGSSSEIDTGIDFDDISLIDKMMIEVGTAFDTNVAMSVGILSTGTNGDSNGFIEDEGVATAGWHNPWRAGVDLTSYTFSSGGEAAAYIIRPAAGTWLMNFGAGTSDTGTFNIGHLNRQQLLIHGTWENSLTYTFGTTAASTGWGMIHFWFTRIR